MLYGSPSRWRRFSQAALVVTCAVVLLGVSTVHPPPEHRERFRKIGMNLICMCGCRQMLLECNHVGCSYSDKMRSEIIAGLQRGESDAEILQYFVQSYGALVLAAPPAKGFNWLAWIMPFFTLVVGASVASLVVRTWRRRRLLQRVPAPAPARAAPLEGFRERARKETEL
jgi:cytochrome c-type biogenesis protein CcmH/NrfF